MSKHILIVGMFVLAIGALIFFDQVLAIFHGMTALEALKTIWTFILHVVVTTILGYVVFGLPEIIKPWLRMFQQKRRALRRGRVTAPKPVTPRMPRFNKDAMLLWMANHMMKSEERPIKSASDATSSTDIQFKL